MATLTVSHYIYLTKEQRYSLHKGEALEVTGVSVPVWFHKGNTSEPAQEIFCKYYLTNEGENKAIVPVDEGYRINLPQKLAIEKEGIPADVQEVVSANLGTSDRLLDIADGGAECLEFRQYNKVQKGIHKFNVVHFVEIKPCEILKDTLS